MIVIWIVAALMVAMAIPLLKGKGAWMISGYNTMSKKERELYDEKALCRYTGKLLLAVAAGMAVMGAGVTDDGSSIALFYAGFALIMIVCVVGGIPLFTMKRFLKADVTVGEYLDARKSRRSSKFAMTAAIAVTVVAIAGVGALFVFGEMEPTVTVHADSVHISGMYGTTIAFADLSEVVLIDDSMRSIGTGRRRNGYALGNTLKGHFSAGLIFVDASSSPTLLIERESASDVFISFSDSEATRGLYRELRAALP